MIVARLIVMILFGTAIGYAVGKSLASDAATGRELTLKQYIADFDSHKKELIDSEMPMAVAVVVGVLMVVVFFGVYELVVLGTDKVLHLVDRPKNLSASTAEPWR
jgi:hypothetical protein